MADENTQPRSALSIRPATAADIGEILRLIAELAEYERAPEQAIATPELLAEHLFAARPAAECVMGEVDGVTQGMALWFMNFSTWQGRPGMYLEDLYVRPNARGLGLGKALLVHLASIAVQRGCRRFEWSVLDWNTPALEFYKALGAEPMTEWTIHRVSGNALLRLAGGKK